jgi:hypothetical protein
MRKFFQIVGYTFLGFFVLILAVGLMVPSDEAGQKQAEKQKKAAAKKAPKTNWGSAQQRAQFVDTQAILGRLDAYTRLGETAGRERISSPKFKNHWFASYWSGTYWSYGPFPAYNSKDECYRKTYEEIFQSTARQANLDLATINYDKAVRDFENKFPVRCFPSGTPVEKRWDYPRI